VTGDDQQWQQPGVSAGQPGYQGPPRTTAPPRRLPDQNHAAIDDDEARARTLTRGLAMVAGALLLVVACSLCGRILF